MPLLVLHYRTAADFAAHLEEHRLRGALLLSADVTNLEVAQYAKLVLQVRFDDDGAVRGGDLAAQLLQATPGLGLVVKLDDPAAAAALVRKGAPAARPEPPKVVIWGAREAVDDGDVDVDVDVEDDVDIEAEQGRPGRAAGQGTTPLSWSVDKLMADWDQLTMADRVRVAKYGKRPARALIIRGTDKTLQSFVLSNPRITPDEVAVLASKVNLEASLLQRIASSTEWTRHLAVARALASHPKLTIPQVTKILRQLPADELRRLARSGKLRASVKRLVIKAVEQKEGRR